MLRNLKKFFNINFKIEECQDEVYDSDSDDEEFESLLDPDLLPEYTDSYEITSIHKIGKASLNFSLYNRYTVDVVERISTFENNISTSQPENVGTNTTIGFEANGKYAPSKWFSINGDFNINYFTRKGAFDMISFDFKGNRWATSLTTKFKLPAEFDLEISGDYRSKFKTK